MFLVIWHLLSLLLALFLVFTYSWGESLVCYPLNGLLFTGYSYQSGLLFGAGQQNNELNEAKKWKELQSEVIIPCRLITTSDTF